MLQTVIIEDVDGKLPQWDVHSCIQTQWINQLFNWQAPSIRPWFMAY